MNFGNRGFGNQGFGNKGKKGGKRNSPEGSGGQAAQMMMQFLMQMLSSLLAGLMQGGQQQPQEDPSQQAQALEQISLPNLSTEELSNLTYDEAKEIISDNTNLSSADAASLFNYGRALEAAGNKQAALAFYENAVEKDPFNAGYRDKLAKAYFVDGKVDKALESYKELVLIDANYNDALLNLGLLQFDQGQIEDSVATLRQAFQTFRDNPLVASSYGSVLVTQEQYSEALNPLNHAISLRESAADYDSLAIAQDALGLEAEAGVSRQRAEDLRSQNLNDLSDSGTGI